ncbi:hypothetical protein BGZ83_008173 [Gryganskiella cystojenkinii]|nr:hypothetical protein BGZ83_008173 [Gryganskiella cystojenkinii]
MTTTSEPAPEQHHHYHTHHGHDQDIQKATTATVIVTTTTTTVEISPSDSPLLSLIFDDVTLAVSDFLVVPLRDLQKELVRAFLDQPNVFFETPEMKDQAGVLFSELFNDVLFNAGLGRFHEKFLYAKTRAIVDTICPRGPANSEDGEDHQVNETSKRLWEEILEAHREKIVQASKWDTLQEFPWFIQSEIRERVELTSRELLDENSFMIVNWDNGCKLALSEMERSSMALSMEIERAMERG